MPPSNPRRTKVCVGNCWTVASKMALNCKYPCWRLRFCLRLWRASYTVTLIIVSWQVLGNRSIHVEHLVHWYAGEFSSGRWWQGWNASWSIELQILPNLGLDCQRLKQSTSATSTSCCSMCFVDLNGNDVNGAEKGKRRLLQLKGNSFWNLRSESFTKQIIACMNVYRFSSFSNM